MDRFEELVKELGRLLNVPLHLDAHRICRLNVSNQLHIQIEQDSSKERLLIATFIDDIPAGRFREDTLKEALRANGVYPRVGTLGFCERNNQLALFDYVYLHSLSFKQFADFLTSFIDKGIAWKKALESGNLPTEPSSRPSDNIFGLKR